MRHFDLAVVGGGVIGAFTAYFAALNGLKVSLIEARVIGSGASGRCAGIHTTQLVVPTDIKLAKLSRDIYVEVAPESITKTGFLSIEPEWMARFSEEALERSGVKYKVLQRSELTDWIDWIIVKDYEVGVYTPDDVTIDVSTLFAALKSRLTEIGVHVYEWTEIHGIDAENAVLLTRGHIDRLSFDKAIFAAGAWNKELLGKLGLWRPPLLIYACYVMKMGVERELSEMPISIEEDHVYLRRFGQKAAIAGNGFVTRLTSPHECPMQPSREFMNEIQYKLLERLRAPDLFRPLGGWVGVCSSSPDGYPVVGPIPNRKNLYIVDALDGYGLMRAPALSQGLVEYILSGVKPDYLGEFDPHRLFNYTSEPESVIELHSRL